MMKKSAGSILYIFTFLLSIALTPALKAGSPDPPGETPVNLTLYKQLNFRSSDPIFTTYAAPINRSNYSSDQAYELMWTDPEKPVGLQSKSGGESGLLFSMGQETRTKLGQFSGEPVIKRTFSDIVELSYQPFKEIDVKAVFCVYSSNACILDYVLTNLSANAVSIVAYPYFQCDQGITDIRHDGNSYFSFHHFIPRDNWMKEHNIPFCENYADEFYSTGVTSGFGIMDTLPARQTLLSGSLNAIRGKDRTSIVMFQHNIILQPGEKKTFRIIRTNLDATKSSEPLAKLSMLQAVDLNQVFSDAEKEYARIPGLQSLGKLSLRDRNDRTALYYSAFSLLRQCMMPPEGKCKHPYYIFSREPKWGWGYGGQVFHESLSMLAYVYMDPLRAMNSQRVFMERQHQDGYINYRTGPYLDETVVTNNSKTSSAPWFSYINYEIYKVTNDRKFLAEAYDNGRKLFNWFLANRDKDEDGLYEWGGDATLECVRDGLVATWDWVSKPENLEGPDLNSMLVMEAFSLSQMAKELKLDRDAVYYLDRARKLADRINNQLWDDETGFYYNTLLSSNSFIFLHKNDLKIKEIIGFLPLWANVCTPDRAKILIQSLANPEEFWRPFGIPTLSAKDPYYNPMGYWNGPVWIEWQYLVFRGLLDYGYKPLARVLADRIMDQMIWHLKNDHTFWEFYSPDDRQAGWNKTYIWAGLVARMMLDMESAQ